MFLFHGKSRNTHEEVILNELLLLHALLSDFHEKDIFNADEFGLFYREAPTTTVGPYRFKGRKKKKDRITFLVCVNSDSSVSY